MTKTSKPTLSIRNRRDSIALAVPTSQVFPKTDFNCQASTLAEFDGLCAGCCRCSFRAISRDYLANESPQHFAREAVLFFIMMMTVGSALLIASAAVLELVGV
jgi:hypothetical protein